MGTGADVVSAATRSEATNVGGEPREHRIVVGVDGSATSTRALDWALDEARRWSASLEVVLAWEYPRLSSAEAFGSLPLGQFEAAANATIAQVVRDVATDAELSGIELIPSVVMASPAGALLAASEGADLLVVGSRGRSELMGLLFGSVSQQCVTHASTAVAVIPPAIGATGATDPSAADEPSTEAGGRLLVGVDGSRGSDAALRWAIDDARRRATSVVALLAYSYIAPYGPLGSINFKSDYNEPDAVAALAAIVARVAGDAPGVEIEQHVECDLAVVALERLATPSDVIVLGARGHGGFVGLLIGSISLKTIAHAPCPVVVLHQPEPTDEG